MLLKLLLVACAARQVLASASYDEPHTPTSSYHLYQDETDAPTTHDHAPTDPPIPADERDFLYPELKDCAPSDVRVTSDEWTTSGTPPNCTFPFVYNDVVYYECINFEYAGRYWCANSCDFEDNNYKRGTCDISDLPESSADGFMGSGVALNALNVFIGIIMTAAAILFLGLFAGELWRRKSSSARVGDESAFAVPGFENQAPTTAGQLHQQQQNFV